MNNIFLSIFFLLSFLTPNNNLIACEISSPLEQEDYPKVSGWRDILKSPRDLELVDHANSLPADLQLELANELMKRGSNYCCHYFEAVINNVNAPTMLREEAILLNTSSVWRSFELRDTYSESRIKRIWQESLRCLHFMIKNENTSENNKVKALMKLGAYYQPEQKTLFRDPKKCEEVWLTALTYQLKPVQKAIILHELAVLYHNKHLGQGTERLITAFTYYDKIDQDEKLPMESRLFSRLNKVKILGSGYYCEETHKDRMALIQSILDHGEASPSLKKQARLYAVDELLKEFNFLKYMFVKKRPGKLEEVISELLRLIQDVSFLDNYQIQQLNVMFVTLLIDLKYVYRLDLKIRGVNNDYLQNLLKELIEQASPPSMDLWAMTVVQVLRLMPTAMNSELKFLNKKKIPELIDKALQHDAICQNIKNTIKGLKVCVVAEGLLPTTTKRGVLKELQEYIMDKSIPQTSKIDILEKLSKHTHRLFPNYNKEIDNTIGYLQTAINDETNHYNLSRLKFILYTFHQAYKGCSLTTEKVAQYVKDLSSDETPEQFRIHITTDDDSEDDEDLKPGIESEMAMTDSHFTAQADTGMLDKVAIDQEQSPTEATQIDITPVVTTSKVTTPVVTTVSTTTSTSITTTAPVTPLPAGTQVLNLPQNRDSIRAQLLLDRLNASRGKVTQKEVANLLRRLDYTFQPTAENGLTIHLGHKGRNNKKGTPGRLDGGRKNDLAKVLQDAIQKALTQ